MNTDDFLHYKGLVIILGGSSHGSNVEHIIMKFVADECFFFLMAIVSPSIMGFNEHIAYKFINAISIVFNAKMVVPMG
jgi:hypothetical protein